VRRNRRRPKNYKPGSIKSRKHHKEINRYLQQENMQTQVKHTRLGNHKNVHSKERFEHIIDFIKQNLQQNITVKTLSREAFMSEPHFFRCFKQQFGMSPVEYINEQRIRAAKMMLHAIDISITEVSFACGFNNLNYFLKMFKRHTGLTPAQYRKSILL